MLQKNCAHFNRFDTKQSITQINKTCASLDSSAHEEYENLYLVSVELTSLKVQMLIQDVIEMKCFIRGKNST